MPEPRIYDAWRHCSWGNHIEVVDWPKRKITGHLTPKPRLGDVIRFQMQSGNVLETIVTEIETFPDPPDQFIATVKEQGYAHR